jgi:hypothetical protein
MCPHTATQCPRTTICALILLYMCPHTIIHVSSYHCMYYYTHVSLYYYICSHTLFMCWYYYVSSGDSSMRAGDKALIKSWMTVLILAYMSPDTSICVSSYRRQRSNKVMDDWGTVSRRPRHYAGILLLYISYSLGITQASFLLYHLV